MARPDPGELRSRLIRVEFEWNWGQTLSLFWGTGYFLSCGHHLQVKSDPDGSEAVPKYSY